MMLIYACLCLIFCHGRSASLLQLRQKVPVFQYKTIVIISNKKLGSVVLFIEKSKRITYRGQTK